MSHARLVSASDINRFLVKVAINSETGCWEWVGGRATAGYGRLWMGTRKEGRQELAHRFSYEIWVAPIPEGLHMDHLCRVRHCVNPEHLEVVTCRENVLRGNAPAASQARQTHCFNGHPLSGDNLDKTGLNNHRRRWCKICISERKKRKRIRDREAREANRND